jgi:hypothetical protein
MFPNYSVWETGSDSVSAAKLTTDDGNKNSFRNDMVLRKKRLGDGQYPINTIYIFQACLFR